MLKRLIHVYYNNGKQHVNPRDICFNTVIVKQLQNNCITKSAYLK